MEHIGIFGGSFNPPHIGHIRAAESAAEILGLAKVLLIPARQVPHKQLPEDAPAPEQRLEMVRLAVQGHPLLDVSDLEISRTGKSYTWDTIRALKEEYPDSQFTLLLGADMLQSFNQWENADKIAENVLIAALSRGKKQDSEIRHTAEALLSQGISVKILMNPVTEISSTQIRRLLAFGCADAYLPQPVARYIRDNHLYDTAANWKNLPMEQLETVVIRLLNPNRVRHVLGCRDTCVALAERWGADRTDAARAGILHDITKALDGPLQLTLCDAYGKILDDFSKKYPKTLHALTGSLVAKRIFGENDAVVSAICSHTTGKPNMNLLEKIVYVADYMEPNRDFPGVEQMRELAFSDLDAALKMGLETTLEYLKEQKNEVSPESIAALRYLTKEENCPC